MGLVIHLPSPECKCTHDGFFHMPLQEKTARSKRSGQFQFTGSIKSYFPSIILAARLPISTAKFVPRSHG
jgi:hypothetical protein